MPFDKKIGKFDEADGGTLFLDEIGDMPLQLQAKMLRVLQDFAFYRLGGQQTISVDTRIIAASNQNLDELIAQLRHYYGGCQCDCDRRNRLTGPGARGRDCGDRGGCGKDCRSVEGYRRNVRLSQLRACVWPF